MKRKFIIATLVGLGLLAVIPLAWSKMDSSASWRYKMSVAVETPEGLRIGSAVREVNVVIKPQRYSEGYNIKTHLNGEAISVDLGTRGVLFVLLKGYGLQENYGSDIPFYAFPGPPGRTKEGLEYYSHLNNIKATLTPPYYPMLVMFKDRKDPKTVTSVLDLEIHQTNPLTYTVTADNFEKLFGKGVRLKSIMIEMTDAPISGGIENWLPWLPEHYKGYLDGQLTGGGPEFSNTLHYGNFKSGDEK